MQPLVSERKKIANVLAFWEVLTIFFVLDYVQNIPRKVSELKKKIFPFPFISNKISNLFIIVTFLR